MITFLYANSFIMTIETYNKKFEEAKGNNKVLYSDPHVIFGYKLRLQVYLNECGEGK